MLLKIGKFVPETFNHVAGAEDPGVPGVAVNVVYQEVRASGRKAVRSAQIKTDDRGLASLRTSMR